MQAIIYTSNTGSTACYADMLSQKISLPAYSMEEAKDKVEPGAEVIYLGWLMASEIKGYKNAVKKYKVRAACGVGMRPTGTQSEEVRKRSNIAQDIPVFTLQGNFDIKKLHGVYKMLMKVMVKNVGKVLAEKADRTPEENDMLDMMLNGTERVSEENLKDILDWYKSEVDSI